MSKLANTLFLALVLLLAQTVLALHDIQCVDEEHAQTCQLCSAHDHSTCNTDSQNKLEWVNCTEETEFASLSVATARRNPLYLSRAPPL